MYYNPKKNMLYLCHARTCSSYTGKMLQSYGFEPTRNHHGTIQEAKNYYPINQNTFIFTTVRNHYSLMVSWFMVTQKSKIANITKYFNKVWMESMLNDDVHFKLVKWIFGENSVYNAFNHSNHSSFIMRYEYLEEQMKQLGFVNFKFNPPKYDYRKFYNEQMKELVYTIFHSEMNKYAYDFNNGVTNA